MGISSRWYGFAVLTVSRGISPAYHGMSFPSPNITFQSIRTTVALDTVSMFSRSKMLKSLVFLNYIVNQKDPPPEYVDGSPGTLTNPVPEEESETSFVYHNSIEFEKALIACVEFGKTERLIGMLNSEKMTDANMGVTANDSLRALKNVFVASVTLASRAAVRGGMDYENAMNISDAYLQTMEALGDYDDVFALWRRMLLDYTEYVRKCRRLNAESKLLHMASNYVLEHVYKSISAESIARALSFNRSYLCSRFKKDTGKNLSRFISEVKIEEAKYLLASTGKPLVDISGLLGFCSQNYFQTVFRQVAGVTPKQYRQSAKLKG